MQHVVDFIEGYVTEVNPASFWTRCEIEGDEYMVEFIREGTVLTEDEKEYVEVGAGFVIGILNTNGTIFNFSKEVWTQAEIDEAKKSAEELIAQLKEIGFYDDIT